MLNPKHTGVIIASALLLAAWGCNSSMSEYEKDSLSSSTMVTSFSISKDDKVLANIDSVFFTIDLQQSLIYNADSLPYGTDVSHLVPVIKTYSGVASAQISFPRENKADSVVDYLTNSTDSIDFSRGPVKLHLVSMDGMSAQNYTISVNVHRVKPDSLVWNRLQLMTLPSSFKSPEAQATAYSDGVYHCLTRSGDKYCMATADDINSPTWKTAEIQLPFVPRLETLREFDESLCILDNAGEMHVSNDHGNTWTSTGEKFHWLYGCYGKSMLGSRFVDGSWQVVSYPEMTSMRAPQGLPVSGTSLSLEYNFEMAFSTQLMITGGRTADGTLVDATWGFDGFAWAKISNTPMPEGLENVAVAPYFTVRTNRKVWTTTRYSTLVAFGGNRADGTLNRDVYVSLDFGITWKKADRLMQLPSYVPAMTGSQAFVQNTVMKARSGAEGVCEWIDMPLYYRLPATYSFVQTEMDALSRATKPISEWECPYVYLFGGYNEQGALYNTVWRGVINRFTFKPIE